MSINPLAAMGANASASGTSGTSSTSSSAKDANQMFLQLLMAQLKNQSPLDPMDGNQFAGQLVQYNMLDQLIQIRTLLGKATTSPQTGPTSSSSGASSSGASNTSVQGAQ